MQRKLRRGPIHGSAFCSDERRIACLLLLCTGYSMTPLLTFFVFAPLSGSILFPLFTLYSRKKIAKVFIPQIPATHSVPQLFFVTLMTVEFIKVTNNDSRRARHEENYKLLCTTHDATWPVLALLSSCPYGR